ncbi:carboxypeptidase-like regulatory domain-containing protein [Sorangium sp. So ce1036]|uniref:carboxypeptidase-like regulatory domain-containing protein n=1 Tax=Sorangium sp. So ce1036 TaxID=3133328 RepID=UPI003F1065FE
MAVGMLCAFAAAGCGGGDEEEAQSCSVAAQTGCAAPQVCEEVEGAEPACFDPVTVTGRVVDSLDDQPIAGARVLARDANDAVISRVAVTKEDGTYALVVPARRDANGVPVKAELTLRADALAYETFPKAPRVALPIDLATAAGKPPTLASAATEIALLPLADGDARGSISGVVHADQPGGTLLVAGGATGAADLDGSYTIFNVTPGEVTVRGYAAGLALDTASATVSADKETQGVDLHAIGEATAVVSGKVEIVNAPGGSATSVILVVGDTFDEATARGEAPRGLRQGDVTGDFSIAGVPDGEYVVLAAFEDDALVRDPDTSIGGTEIVRITVSGGDVPVQESFKVTEALAVVSPGASTLDEVSGAPTFVFRDDSSEDLYEVTVFDALGTKVWEDLEVPRVTGSENVSVEYGGPALIPGMIYQFRATSMKAGTPISQTEDLKGVFLYR